MFNDSYIYMYYNNGLQNTISVTLLICYRNNLEHTTTSVNANILYY